MLFYLQENSCYRLRSTQGFVKVLKAYDDRRGGIGSCQLYYLTIVNYLTIVIIEELKAVVIIIVIVFLAHILNGCSAFHDVVHHSFDQIRILVIVVIVTNIAAVIVAIVVAIAVAIVIMIYELFSLHQR
jgi:hypothetical protein